MELRDYWRLILRYLPLVVASTAIGILAAGIYTFTATPSYDATAQIFISTPAASLDISALATGSSFSQQRVKSYAQIINGPATLQPVIDELHLNTTVELLAKRVSATAPLDTVLINVKVSDTNPNTAADIANSVTKHFAATVDALEIAQSGGGSPVKVSTVKNAVPPLKPASPKKTLNLLLGLILGFGLGLGLATLRQLFDNTVKNEDHLAGVPLLAAIGFDVDATTKPLLTQIGRYSSRAESFRQLRTNLQFIRSDNPPTVIAVSSALPNEGKTTTSLNLAITLSQAGYKVALIEADLRRPKVSQYLDETISATGLSEVLTGRAKFTTPASIAKILTPWGDNELRILPSGAIPPNPAELLNSETMDRLITGLRAAFDYVILDCAPLLPVTDAAIIASKSDGVLLIARAGVTKISQFQGASDAITAVGSSVLGAVLNMVPLNRAGADYGYRYGIYSYYGSKYRPYAGRYKPYGAKYAPEKPYAPRSE